MPRYILRRLILLIPVLLGVSFLVFSIMALTPGDPVEMYLGDNYTQESYATLRSQLGLDQPFIVRYARYIVRAIQGDLGTSYTTGRSVATEIGARLPATVALAAAALLIATAVGIPLGTISATRQYSVLDSVSMLTALIGVSMPNFWFGLMLILVFAAWLGLLPSSGFKDVRSLILPALTLSANSLAIITRMNRSSMLETIRQDYIRTARAKGVPERDVIRKHALKNAMIPVITTIGLQFGFALGGSVLVETVFSWPGVGRLLVETIRLKDTPVVLAIVMVLAVTFSMVNLLIDILYAFFDPRIRAQYK